MAGLAALGLVACVGSIPATNPEPGAGNAPTSDPRGTPPDPSSPTCNEPRPGAAPIRRLTRFEYSNTVRDLLGDTTRPGDLLPPELRGNGFSNDAASLTTTRVLVDAYRSVARDLATRATGNAAALARLGKCDAQKSGEDACAQLFVDDFGARAFRRPLERPERDAFLGVYRGRAGWGGTTHADGLAAVVETILQSPQFLYRVEMGTPVPGLSVARPTSYEMASRLSYLLWGSMPDLALFEAARLGQLESKEQVLAQARRLLDDARAKEVVRFFADALYGISGIDGLRRDATFFPTYKPELAALFRQETEQFVDHTAWEGTGDFATLMSGPFTYLNGPLAKFYGVPGVSGDAFRRVELDPKRRAGVLTQASLLAITTPGSHNDPVVRGKFIYTKLLCGQVPDPPPGLMVRAPEPDPTRTTRERFIAHRTDPSCAACHTRLDPIGFGLENYNGVGLWQDTDNGKRIDASGEIPDGDAAGPFVGAIELARKIAGSRDAQDCFAGQWLGFAYGRVAQKEDACTRASLTKAFADSRGNIRELLLALTQTDAFLYRPKAEDL